MDKATITKFRWFWTWQDEKEESWLGEMSSRGYHLSVVSFPGFYKFNGEHIGEMNAWQYFRKEAVPGEQPEIFTDNESKINKYKRLLGYLCIFLLPLWTVFIIQISVDSYSWMKGIQIFILIVSLFFIYAVIRILLRIRKLKSL
jgi:hypothetical protein